jgi:hypothetical protein
MTRRTRSKTLRRHPDTVEGMVAATAVGALAGLLPAIIAVRAKVIDAIR